MTADELKNALRLALKAAPAKPHFFVMVTKGADGALLVDKRKVAAKAIDAAKKELGSSSIVKGLCFGEEGTLVFETAKPPAGNLAAIAKRVAQVKCGLAIKPDFRQGRDEEAMSDEDEAPSAQGALPQPVASASAAPPAAAAPAAASASAPSPAAPSAAEDAAHKAYAALLAKVMPRVAAARDEKSALVPKLASLLEFAAGKAAAGDHRAAIQALQGMQALLVQGASSASSSSSSPSPTAAAGPSAAARGTTTARARAPIEPEAARDFLAKVDPAEEADAVAEATAGVLDDLRKKLQSSRRMVTVKNVDELAAEMARENKMSVEAAKEMIENNQGRGFTGRSGTVYVLGNTPQAAHDEVHETVHLMSAPGGATKIMAKYGEQLNEALTEFFTKEMCRRLKVPDAVAYPEHVAFMNKLVPVVGYDRLYTAYMKNGGFDPVIDRLTDMWIAKFKDLPDPQKPPNVKGEVNREKARAAMDSKFLNNFPPPAAAMKFWNTVFFA